MGRSTRLSARWDRPPRPWSTIPRRLPGPAARQCRHRCTHSAGSTLQTAAPVGPGVGAAQAADGNIYLAGGLIGATELPPRDVRIFDPSTGAWAKPSSLLWGDQIPSVVVLGDKDVYIIGGWNDTSYDPRVEEATIPPVSIDPSSPRTASAVCTSATIPDSEGGSGYHNQGEPEGSRFRCVTEIGRFPA